MTVRIGEITSEVIPEPEVTSGAAQSGGRSSESRETVEAVRVALSSLIRDRMRTRAESFDD
jgi:hypothetical protein